MASLSFKSICFICIELRFSHEALPELCEFFKNPFTDEMKSGSIRREHFLLF